LPRPAIGGSPDDVRRGAADRRQHRQAAGFTGRSQSVPDELSLREYFHQIAGENAKQAIAQFGDLRLAINAIMTLDGFFGRLHTELHNTGTVKEPSDDRWKETLAKGNKSYQVLRDMAYALKHGTLTHPKPRLVTRADQIQRYPVSFDSALFDRSAFDTKMVWIEGQDTDYRADEVIGDVVVIAEEWLAKIPK
jgi:hypothetical protein